MSTRPDSAVASLDLPSADEPILDKKLDPSLAAVSQLESAAKNGYRVDDVDKATVKEGEEVGKAPSPAMPSSPPVLTNGDDIAAPVTNGIVSADARDSESEAETIVLDNGQGARRAESVSKTEVKHEEKSDDDGDGHPVEEMDIDDDNTRKNGPARTIENAPAHKARAKDFRKDRERGNSSGLSSVPTSPPIRGILAKKEEMDHDKPKSPSRLSVKERNRVSGKLRKRKLGEDESDDDGVSRESTTPHRQLDTPGAKDRRETRSATARPCSPHHVTQSRRSQDRSVSPRVRTHRRAVSTQSAPHSTNGQNNKRRKLPPPPVSIASNRNKSEEAQSYSSSANSSPHPHSATRKLSSADAIVLSPAKMPPHKKHRDQIGRTFFARACANSDIEAAKTRLKDRPQDIDEADYAGNTPLQIASLEGSVEIVKLLIDRGCDVHCKNNEKDTPLIDAVENGHLEVVRLLLSAGANPKQGNAKGEEPLDLLNDEDENYEPIKKALLDAIRVGPRRTSDDQELQLNAIVKESGRTSRGESAHSPRHSPPTAPLKSPPSSMATGRRRNARSEVSRNDLLWMSTSSERLREMAGKGDLEGVGRILEMKPQADTESFIAAARGGHDEVMQLLLAMGNAEPDPEPIKSATHKQGYNTPMLAAIGRGSDKVVKLLLEQQHFNPTRLDHRGRTYFEVAKERQGLGWEKEYALLKQAYDSHSKGRKVKPTGHSVKTLLSESSRHARDKDRESKRSTKTDPSSPPHKKPMRSPTHRTSESTRIKHEDSGHKESKRSPTDASGIKTDKMHKSSSTKSVTQKSESGAVSDGESALLGPPKMLKIRRSESDAAKPRRKLISGRDLKSDRVKPMRPSVSGSEGEGDKKVERGAKIKSELIKARSLSKPKAEDSRSRVDVMRNEAVTKRSRESVSPQRSSSLESETRKVGDDGKKKRRRIDSEGHDANSKRAGLVTSGNKIKTKDHADKPTKPRDSSSVESKVLTADRTSQSKEARREAKKARLAEASATLKEGNMAHQQDQARAKKRLSKEMDVDSLDGTDARKSPEAKHIRLESDAKLVIEKEAQDKVDRERENQLQREQADNDARLQKEADEARQAAAKEESARQEAQAARVKVEAAERKAREEEAAAIERKRREEEAQRRRQEAEVRRREETERRRREAEARERAEQLRRQEEEERLRREALPFTFRKQAERSAEENRSPEVIRSWLPLFSAPQRQLQPDDCPPELAEDIWIVNYQVAPLLGERDLALSQFTAWEKRPFTADHQYRMFRAMRKWICGPRTDSPSCLGATNRPKFEAMQPKFWLRLADFLDLVPRYPHLAGVEMRTCWVDIRVNCFPPGTPSWRPKTPPPPRRLGPTGMQELMLSLEAQDPVLPYQDKPRWDPDKKLKTSTAATGAEDEGFPSAAAVAAATATATSPTSTAAAGSGKSNGAPRL